MVIAKVMHNKTEKISLEDLGYVEFFESNRKDLGLQEYSVARVISEQRGSFTIKNENGEYSAKVKGRKIFHATTREDYPAVGDWVVLNTSDLSHAETATIQEVLPRKTVLKKKYSNKEEDQVIATNVDGAFIVESVERDYNLNRLERYAVLVQEEGIKSIIVLNKVDLLSEKELQEKLAEIQDRLKSVAVMATSTTTGQGVERFESCIEKGKTYCFLGSSGVGKSSLINRLLGKESIRTQDIGNASGRGMHTTTTRDMYFLENGGIVIDNPGVREVGMVDIDVESGEVFSEIVALSRECKYADCTHTREPKCAVLGAVESGELDRGAYENYVKLKKESDHYAMSKREKRNKDRKFGKFVKKVMEEKKRYKE